jgi:hypothetical protein
VIQQAELDGYRFVPPEELPGYLPDYNLARVRPAIMARESGATVYVLP